MLNATYTKLRDGEWGVRVSGKPNLGDVVQVRKQSGETKQERVTRVVWSDSTISICAIERSQAPSAAAPRRALSPTRRALRSAYGRPRGGCGYPGCDGVKFCEECST